MRLRKKGQREPAKQEDNMMLKMELERIDKIKAELNKEQNAVNKLTHCPKTSANLSELKQRQKKIIELKEQLEKTQETIGSLKSVAFNMKETGSGELSKLYKSNYQKFCKVLIQYICRGGDDRQFAFDTINELMTKKQENEFKIQLREYEKNHARKPSALESLIADLRRGKTATEVDTAINYVEVVKDKDIKWLKANVWPKVDKKTMKILLRNLLYLEKNAAQTAKNPFHPSNTIQYSYKPRVRSMKDITHVGTCKDFRETLPFREEDLNGCIHQLMFYLRDADGVWRNDSK